MRYRVHANEHSYWANCGWDAFGIAVMLGSDARIEATCADCDEYIEITVTGDRVMGDDEGEVLTLEQTWTLSKLWYNDWMAPEFRGRTVDEAVGIFRQLGLSSDFWYLPRV